MAEEFKGKIIITTTGIRITPYRKGQSYYLELFTSVTDYPYKRRKPITGFLLPISKDDKKNGIFVSHKHDLTFLQNQFPDYQIIQEEPIKAKQLNYEVSFNENITPREVQYQIIQGILDNEKADNWFVHLLHGFGKTLLSVYMIPYFNVKTFIMCFNKDILEQWIHGMIENTSLKKEAILYIDSSELLHKIATGDFPSWDYDVFMCTPKLLVGFGARYGWDQLDVVMNRMGIGLKIFDEAHRNITNIIKINALTNVKRTLYLSGDFAQASTQIQNLYYKIFHNVPILEPSTDLMESLKYTIAVVVFFNSRPTELDKAGVYTRRGFSYYSYMKYEIRKPDLYNALRFVIDGIRKTNAQGYRILILANMVDHVEEIADMLRSEYKSEYNIQTYHNEKTYEEKKECKDNSNMIVSTYQSFREGINVSLIKYVISCSICTKIDDSQASGRARPLPDGSDAYYFMLSDLGFEYTTKKLKERLKYLKEVKIKKIERIEVDSDI